MREICNWKYLVCHYMDSGTAVTVTITVCICI